LEEQKTSSLHGPCLAVFAGWPGSEHGLRFSAYRLSLASRREVQQLSAQPADNPEEQAEQRTYEDRSSEWKGDRPSATLPFKVTWKSAEGKIRLCKRKDHKTCKRENSSEEDKSSAEVLHNFRLSRP
jgi:hypothetical protein